MTATDSLWRVYSITGSIPGGSEGTPISMAMDRSTKRRAMTVSWGLPASLAPLPVPFTLPRFLLWPKSVYSGMGKQNGRDRLLIRQGDIFIQDIKSIPQEAQLSPLPHGVLVHGEVTGHSHRLE